ncbi:TIGR02679 family protein [Gordonia phthalatica]|uniref:TIGR02679 family protein n=1 Tax=Gordonia phthalatica TaxID=1136941 RepID=A0A0N9NAE4_9ACTN|nr:TIGR02679 family protein [Gordonia phthalatica]ALG85309.1 hypothetical protein ACH46_13535 [Gordonia phthalatica]
MVREDRGSVERLLRAPELAWFVDRIRNRLPGAVAGEPLSGTVRLPHPTPQQRTAMADLIGRPRRSGVTLSVKLDDVETMLRRGPWPAGLADLVVSVSGPVVDRSAQRRADDARWAAVAQRIAPVVERFPAVGPWWESWCAAGKLKRVAQSEARRMGRDADAAVGAGLVEAVVAVFDDLPADGVLLAMLARRVLGDAHALDQARPLGRLTSAVVAAAFESAADASTREVWGDAGVVMSGLSSTALCLGVRGRAGVADHAAATSAALEAMRAARSPLVLTLDQVRSGGVDPLGAHESVHVCENPSVVDLVSEGWRRGGGVARAGDGQAGAGPADDEEAWAGSPVLVCTEGQPSSAVMEVLAILTSRGARCRYHGDFDWAGLRIAQFVASKVPWSPWRYGVQDYLEAIGPDAPSIGLSDDRAESAWDPALSVAMAEHGLAVEEEAVAALLAEDLVR